MDSGSQILFIWLVLMGTVGFIFILAIGVGIWHQEFSDKFDVTVTFGEDEKRKNCEFDDNNHRW